MGANNDTFQNFENITGGSGNDTFVFQHNGADDNIAGILNGGAGNNVADYSAFTGDQNIQLGVNVINIETLHGGTGNNTLTGADADNAWSIAGFNNGTVAATPGVTTAFDHFGSLVGNVGNDTFSFQPGASLSGSVTGACAGTEELDFSTYGSPLQYVLSDVEAGNGNVSIISGGFFNINTLQGTGDSTLAGASNDSLTDDGSDPTWFITGIDSGTVGIVNFSGIANLIGQADSSPTFFFEAGSNVFGTVTGGGSSTQSTLDFSTYGAAVTVNLQTSSVGPIFNGASGGFSGFTNFNADYLGSTLIGTDEDSNWLIFGEGNGSITSGLEPVIGGKGLHPDAFVSSISFTEFTNLQGGLGNDTFTMSASGGTQGLVDGHVWGGSNGAEPNDGSNMSGHDVLAYDSNYTSFGNGTSVSVDLGAGTATGITGGIASIDQVSIAGGNNTLTAPNTDNIWVIDAENAGTLNNVPFSGFDNLVGGTLNDAFEFESSGSVVGMIDGTIAGGGGALNTLDYSGYGLTVTVDLDNSSATGINGGNSSGFSGINNLVGNANATLEGKNENTDWNLSNSTAGTVTNDATGNTPYSYTFSGFATLLGGSGDDTFNLATNEAFEGTLNGGGGNNTLSYATFTVPVTVNLGGGINGVLNIQTIVGGSGTGTNAGNNTIIGDAPNGNDPFGHYVWDLTGTGNGSVSDAYPIGDDTVYFFGFQNLTGSDADDTFIFGPGSSIPGTLDGQGGDNTLDFGTAPFGVAIELNLAAGTVTTLSNGSPIGNLVASSFDILKGSGVTGTGGDTIAGANVDLSNNATDLNWDIYGDDAGIITDSANDGYAFSFSGVSNLVGGGGNDTFAIGNEVAVTGTIDGGGGINTLDYSDYGTPVTVDIAHASATNIFGGANGGFSNITDFVGSNTGDSLYGPFGDHTWFIQGTDSGSISSIGYEFTNFANLFGRGGNDAFYFFTGSTLTGTVDGGFGHNTLNYSCDSDSILVNLQNDSSTNIDGGADDGFMHFHNFVGGANSTLEGKDEDSIWNLNSSTSGTVGNAANFPFYSDTFSGFATLLGGSGNDVFNLAQNDAFDGTLNGGGGNNTLSYATFTVPVTVNLGGGANGVLNIQTIIGGSGTGTNAGNNTIIGDAPNANDPFGHYIWDLTGTGNGSVSDAYPIGDDTVYFFGFQNLTGSSADDTFIFGPGSSVPGTLDGQGGDNTLDFGTAPFGVPIELNLADGTVTTLSNGSPIGNLIASSFDILKGSGVTGTGGDTIAGANVDLSNNPTNLNWDIYGIDAGIITDSANDGYSFNFSGVANLIGGGGNDNFAIGDGAAVTGTVDGSAGLNTLNYSAIPRRLPSIWRTNRQPTSSATMPMVSPTSATWSAPASRVRPATP